MLKFVWFGFSVMITVLCYLLPLLILMMAVLFFWRAIQAEMLRVP